jgi:mannose-6-phosphate isomerase-like protein (cupin superfamily)
VHERSDETFYVIAGEVEFLFDGEPVLPPAA